MRDERDGERHLATESRDDLGRVVARAVVDDEHLEPPIDAALPRNRQQAAAQMAGPFERANDDGDVGRRGHGPDGSESATGPARSVFP
jgi:hypothetical protein